MPTATSPPASRTKLLRGYLALAALLAALVLVQAWMAGTSNALPYGGDLDIVLHGIVGNVSYLIAVAALVVALVARAPKGAVAVSAVIVALMTAQIGLGYSAGANRSAGAWHIPLGVLIFGLAVHQTFRASTLARSEKG